MSEHTYKIDFGDGLTCKPLIAICRDDGATAGSPPATSPPP